MMPEIAAPVAVAPAACAKCAAPLPAQVRFCEACGAAVPGVKPSARAKGRAALGRLSANAHLSQIRSARMVIALVALLTLAFTIFTHVQFSAEVARLRLNPEFVINEQALAHQNMLYYANYLIVAIYGALILWVKRNPFAACLTALIIYLSLFVLNVAINPATIYQGIILRVVIILLLAKGVKSGLAYRRLQAKGAVA
jgi:hypothetical protein